MIPIGNVRIHPLSDGIFWADGGGLFGLVPRVLWEKVVAPDTLNRVPMVLRCLLIESAGKRILVDTGYGDKLTDKERNILGLSGEGRLLADLARLGFRAEDIDIVLNTHLHADHCGGNTRWNEHHELVPTFPRAEYWVQRLELADARFPDERTRGTYFADNFLPLERAEQLRVIDGDTIVTPELRLEIAPGHTRSHQVVIAESLGASAIFLADAASWAWALERLAWVPAYDVEPLVSIQTKKRLARWAIARQALLLFQHDPRLVSGRLREEDGRFKVDAEEVVG
jgi:glyoxylase-like metal-dependent hydrolase (beta-lactamase superfamily II)